MTEKEEGFRPFVTHHCRNTKLKPSDENYCNNCFMDVDKTNCTTHPPTWKYCPECEAKGFKNKKTRDIKKTPEQIEAFKKEWQNIELKNQFCDDINGTLTRVKYKMGIKTSKKEYIPTEAQEQELFCNYLKANGYRFTSTQNGAVLGGNRFAQMAKLKKTGLICGFPDLIVFAKNQSGTQNVLMVEMKRVKLGKVSDAQKEWINWLDSNGYYVAIAKGHEQAIKFFNEYLRS